MFYSYSSTLPRRSVWLPGECLWRLSNTGMTEAPYAGLLMKIVVFSSLCQFPLGSPTFSQSPFEVVHGRLLAFLAWAFCEPRSVKARRGQKHRCKSGKGKEQKDKPIFQPGMTFFVFERLFHCGRFHED